MPRTPSGTGGRSALRGPGHVQTDDVADELTIVPRSADLALPAVGRGEGGDGRSSHDGMERGEVRIVRRVTAHDGLDGSHRAGQLPTLTAFVAAVMLLGICDARCLIAKDRCEVDAVRPHHRPRDRRPDGEGIPAALHLPVVDPHPPATHARSMPEPRNPRLADHRHRTASRGSAVRAPADRAARRAPMASRRQRDRPRREHLSWPVIDEFHPRSRSHHRARPGSRRLRCALDERGLAFSNERGRRFSEWPA
jgi:hypothetical protein